MRRAHVKMAVLFVLVCLSPVALTAQVAGGSGGLAVAAMDTFNRDRSVKNRWVVAGKVTTLEGEPIQGAVVEVDPLHAGGEFRSLISDLQGNFLTDYWLNVSAGNEFSAILTVTKKGYLRAHATIELTDPSQSQVLVIPVTLREPGEDPKLLPQAALISRLAPRLKKLGASDGLSVAEEKDYARGVEEFLNRKRPDQALTSFLKVNRHDPSCVQCRTMLALAELDSGDWDGAYRNLGQAVEKIRADSSLGRSEPLLALGVMESWRRQPKDAAAYFLEALKYAPRDPLVLQELGRSQVLIENWEPADKYLSEAMAAGAGREAQLLRAEALLGLDQLQAASVEMTRYLNGQEVKTMPLEVRQLWVQIENRKKIEASFTKAQPKGEEAIDHYLRHPPHDLDGLQPATSQKPLNSILSAVGKTVAEYFQNFPNTTSLEDIHQEKLDRKKKAGNTLDRKFRYLCFTPAKAWGPGFDEYRVDTAGARTSPQIPEEGFMLTSGFASTSLLFHPAYQSQAAFRYLGRQKVGARDTYVIAFAQQPGKARVYGIFKFREMRMMTFSQGLAWVDGKSYEIIRLRSDLLAPLPEVKLERETTEIAFADVQFKTIGKRFSLPQQVTVTVDWNGKHLQNEHRYSDFRLFNVEATEKRKPEGPGATSSGVPNTQTPP